MNTRYRQRTSSDAGSSAPAPVVAGSAVPLPEGVSRVERLTDWLERSERVDESALTPEEYYEMGLLCRARITAKKLRLDQASKVKVHRLQAQKLRAELEKQFQEYGTELFEVVPKHMTPDNKGLYVRKVRNASKGKITTDAVATAVRAVTATQVHEELGKLHARPKTKTCTWVDAFINAVQVNLKATVPVTVREQVRICSQVPKDAKGKPIAPAPDEIRAHCVSLNAVNERLRTIRSSRKEELATVDSEVQRLQARAIEILTAHELRQHIVDNSRTGTRYVVKRDNSKGSTTPPTLRVKDVRLQIYDFVTKSGITLESILENRDAFVAHIGTLFTFQPSEPKEIVKITRQKQPEKRSRGDADMKGDGVEIAEPDDEALIDEEDGDEEDDADADDEENDEDEDDDMDKQ